MLGPKYTSDESSTDKSAQNNVIDVIFRFSVFLFHILNV